MEDVATREEAGNLVNHERCSLEVRYFAKPSSSDIQVDQKKFRGIRGRTSLKQLELK